MSALLSLLADLREQRTFIFEEPWRLSSRSLGMAVPIVRKEYGPRKYVLLDELPGGVDVRDSGAIRKLIARSGVDKPVFIRGGLVLEGETQPRAVRFSVVILPGEEKALEALCVDEARPIRHRARMAPARDVPIELYEHVVEGDQGRVWDTVRHLARRISPEQARELVREMIMSYAARYYFLAAPMLERTTDLLRISEELERARKEIGAVIERFPLLKDQVGVAILDARGVYAMELFDHPDSWSAVARNAGRKFAEVLAEEAEYEIFEPKKEGIMKAIRAFLDKLAACDEEVVFENRLSRTAVLKGEDVRGEYTVLEGSVIHLMAVRSREGAREEEEIPF